MTRKAKTNTYREKIVLRNGGTCCEKEEDPSTRWEEGLKYSGEGDDKVLGEPKLEVDQLMPTAGVAPDYRERRNLAHQQAIDWLSKHRGEYAGQWIGLQGNRLLATAQTAKEVFARVEHEKPTALVLKIESEELPFAGW